jgi:hypothetical protein
MKTTLDELETGYGLMHNNTLAFGKPTTRCGGSGARISHRLDIYLVASE